MGLIESMTSAIFGRPSDVLRTPTGDYNLDSRRGRKNFKKIVMELQKHTDLLTKKDMGHWRQAWQMAILSESPNRNPLYDIYRDVDVDLHLSGCVAQRRDSVMARTFKIVNKADGKAREDLMPYFETSWFKDLMKYGLESVWWGHSLVELGDLVTDEEGRLTYDKVTLIPRKHVLPHCGVVIRSIGDDPRSGIPYREEPFCHTAIEFGKPDDLGLYLKAATQTIPKKHTYAFWDTFAELFAIPMRVAKTSTRDEKELSKLEKMMQTLGFEGWMVAPPDTEVEIVGNTRTDAFNVYDKRLERADSELSKLAIGQTMTVDNGSSKSQSEVHLEVFERIIESDGDMLRDIINTRLIPIMIRDGFPLKGCRLDWDYEEDYTPEQQIAYEKMIADRYEVPGEYFAEKYKMPVGKRIERAMPGPQDPDEPEDKKKGKKEEDEEPEKAENKRGDTDFFD